MNNRVRAGVGTAMLAMLAAPGVAFAQRASENAVTSADDAFGTSVGLETTGVYTDADTRGFSPVKAGNARVDGIYYDPVGVFPNRLRASTAIRVGFAAEGFPFHAPTGIADYKFRPFPAETGLSLGYNGTGFGGFIVEVDYRLLLANDKIGVTGGGTRVMNRYTDGSGFKSWAAALRPIIRLGSTEISPYYAKIWYSDNRTHPLAVVTDAFLPEFPNKRRFLGQRWAEGRYFNAHSGVTLKAPITDRLSLRAGLFHSAGDRQSNYTSIYSIVAPSGLANHRLIADPKHDIHSTSGEILGALRLGDGHLQHRLFAGFRGRNRLTDFGGSDIRNFGQIIYGEKDPEPEPDLVFTRPNEGRLRQSSWLLGYFGKLEGVGTLNLGIQKARYRATSRDGRTGFVTTSRDDPWLYNATVSVDLSKSLSLYVGTERGLEDSGTAPENAANRNAQLPATRSTQYEGGVRWKFPGGQLAVNAFQIEKPYFSFDAANVFSDIGDVRHRGIETSLSGRFGKRLSLLAGAVALQARVTGPARDLGIVGKRPAGTPSLYARIDANYRTDLFGGLTPTASLIYTGKRAVGSRPLAALDGKQLMVPSALVIDLGLRQQFKVGRVPASFRATLNNAFDKQSWKVVAANTLYVDERRRFTFTVNADF